MAPWVLGRRRRPSCLKLRGRLLSSNVKLLGLSCGHDVLNLGHRADRRCFDHDSSLTDASDGCTRRL
jgi:hypothetical protein